MLTQCIIIDDRDFDAVIVTVGGRYQKHEDLILTRASLRDLASFITQDRNLRTEQCLRNLRTAHARRTRSLDPSSMVHRHHGNAAFIHHG
jgi:hypothetical protein